MRGVSFFMLLFFVMLGFGLAVLMYLYAPSKWSVIVSAVFSITSKIPVYFKQLMDSIAFVFPRG